jgi:hypothetical protein
LFTAARDLSCAQFDFKEKRKKKKEKKRNETKERNRTKEERRNATQNAMKFFSMFSWIFIANTSGELSVNGMVSKQFSQHL